ncbi:MAG: hypothetical protein PHQ23_17005 [Candidatus Wallbacteria bacterium]|nr:hypothetical protein [Candidatus Wallbacteria bacterium]
MITLSFFLVLLLPGKLYASDVLSLMQIIPYLTSLGRQSQEITIHEVVNDEFPALLVKAWLVKGQLQTGKFEMRISKTDLRLLDFETDYPVGYISYKEAKSIAESLLKKIHRISQIEYRLCCIDHGERMNLGWRFSFRPFYNAIPCAQTISISIGCDGNVRCIVNAMLPITPTAEVKLTQIHAEEIAIAKIAAFVKRGKTDIKIVKNFKHLVADFAQFRFLDLDQPVFVRPVYLTFASRERAQLLFKKYSCDELIFGTLELRPAWVITLMPVDANPENPRFSYYQVYVDAENGNIIGGYWPGC